MTSRYPPGREACRSDRSDGRARLHSLPRRERWSGRLFCAGKLAGEVQTRKNAHCDSRGLDHWCWRWRWCCLLLALVLRRLLVLRLLVLVLRLVLRGAAATATAAKEDCSDREVTCHAATVLVGAPAQKAMAKPPTWDIWLLTAGGKMGHICVCV